MKEVAESGRIVGTPRRDGLWCARTPQGFRLELILRAHRAARDEGFCGTDDAELVERSRIVMEKPFGVDLASAVSLNRRLHAVFDEDQIFRIDHFLGKEPAQNILAFRFANGLFEPIWNRNFIDHVQIDVPETLGLATRAAFYEAVAAATDRSKALRGD